MIVVAIQRAEGTMEFNPAPEAVMRAGDELVVLGTAESVKALGERRGGMSARVLDGQALARRMQEEIKPEVAAFTPQHGRPPGLGIVLVGNNPASEVYVRNKVKAGGEVGFRADLERLPATATLADTLALVERLNRERCHDGILVQSPLPKAMGDDAEQRVFDAIAPAKDVDGFTP